MSKYNRKITFEGSEVSAEIRSDEVLYKSRSSENTKVTDIIENQDAPKEGLGSNIEVNISNTESLSRIYEITDNGYQNVSYNISNCKKLHVGSFDFAQPQLVGGCRELSLINSKVEHTLAPSYTLKLNLDNTSSVIVDRSYWYALHCMAPKLEDKKIELTLENTKGFNTFTSKLLYQLEFFKILSSLASIDKSLSSFNDLYNILRNHSNDTPAPVVDKKEELSENEISAKIEVSVNGSIEDIFDAPTSDQ